MPTKLVLFMGAPEAASLNWEIIGLKDTFDESIVRFAQMNGTLQGHTSLLGSSTFNHPSWRSIPLDRQQLTTGISQDHAWKSDRHHDAQFFAPSAITSFMDELSISQGHEAGQSQVSSLASVEQILSQFYEESYAVHQDIPSSQIEAVSQALSSFASNGFSYDTTESFESALRPSDHQNQIPTSGPLTNLDDIPNAAYLNNLGIQTMTINIIVGIITNPAPRTIRTRRGADIELVELLVGDESKSGFGVNFWLQSSQSGDNETENHLASLRPQDVVLLRNVALSSFRGKVYGQSLRKNMTKVHLLYRNRVDRSDIGGCYSATDLASKEIRNSQLEKTQSVREWIARFVGASTGRQARKRGAEESFREILPLDDTE